MSSFNDWFNDPATEDEHGEFEVSVPEAMEIAWNAAIKQAADIVRANYDGQEPWLEVSDIEDLCS